MVVELEPLRGVFLEELFRRLIPCDVGDGVRPQEALSRVVQIDLPDEPVLALREFQERREQARHRLLDVATSKIRQESRLDRVQLIVRLTQLLRLKRDKLLDMDRLAGLEQEQRAQETCEYQTTGEQEP